MPEFIQGSNLLEAAWAAGVFLASVLIAWLIFVMLRWIGRRHGASLLSQLVRSLGRPWALLIAAEGLLLALSYPAALEGWRAPLGRLSVIAALVIGTYAVARVAGAFLQWYMAAGAARGRSRVDPSVSQLMRRVVLLVIWVIGILMLLDYQDIDISALIAGLGLGGLAVALALQPTLGNFFAGTQLVGDRAIKAGDYIELDNGTRGYVVQVGWRSTRLRTPFNNVVIVPNSRLADSLITNYYGPTMAMGVMVYCGISYDSDLAHVERVALDVARGVVDDLDEAVKTFEPWFGFEKFGDSNIDFWIWVQAVDRVASFRMTSELIKRLHARLGAEGITINYPVRRLVYDNPKEPPPLPGANGRE